MKNLSYTNILKAFLPPAVVFFFHLLSIFFLNVYAVWPWFDIPMHFIGGASIGWTGVLLLKELKRIEWYSAHKIIDVFAIVCFTTFIAVLWEWHEFLLDVYLGWRTQLSIADTMLDLFLGSLGAFVVAFFGYIDKKT